MADAAPVVGSRSAARRQQRLHGAFTGLGAHTMHTKQRARIPGFDAPAARRGGAAAALIVPCGDPPAIATDTRVCCCGDYVGARLLRRMGWREPYAGYGWREGGGIGPRRRADAERDRDGDQHAGRSSLSTSESDGELVCPDDAEIPDLPHRRGTQGVGSLGLCAADDAGDGSDDDPYAHTDRHLYDTAF
eukprot:gene35592-16778_t